MRYLTKCAEVLMLCVRLDMPPSRGGSLAHYHVVAISLLRFLLDNRRLGLEPANQKELISSVFEPRVLNLRVEQFFEDDFL